MMSLRHVYSKVNTGQIQKKDKHTHTKERGDARQIKNKGWQSGSFHLG